MQQQNTDKEVDYEIQKMISFIRQESLEKAREIQLKANEEFHIEKAKLVQQEAIRIQDVNCKKQIEIENKSKISLSSSQNKSKLKLQQKREECFEKLYANCIKCISEDFQRQPEKYKTHISNCLLQVCAMMKDEDEIIVSCRKEDSKVLDEIILQISQNSNSQSKNPDFEESSIGTTVKGSRNSKNTEQNDDSSLSSDASFVSDNRNYVQSASKSSTESVNLKIAPNDGRHNPMLQKIKVRNEYLAENSIGGIICHSANGKIKCDNTLETRLTLTMQKLAPEIRRMLFDE